MGRCADALSAVCRLFLTSCAPIFRNILLCVSSQRRLRLYHLLLGPSIDGFPVYPFRFGIPLVLKQTNRTVSTEAHALLSLNKLFPHPLIPTLIDSFQIDGVTWTLMTKLPGCGLDEVHENLTDDQITLICGQVLTVMRDVWRVPQPSELGGQVMVSASGHGLKTPRTFFEFIGKPRASIADCFQTVIDDWDDQPPAVKEVLTNDRVVWVHVDLCMRNILVTPHDGRLSGIVDWEDSAWLLRSWLLHVQRQLRLGCAGYWWHYWNNEHRFEPELEAAYSAANEILSFYLAP
ncbi:kinase-like domain-containing protein [Favolaschia claudopus]|uniref:Kinase-like domain-containing protein n=1 Tax=Favolaschia claudopus TaxID=2862362 RepID=A0AAW0EFS1_9AGAR